MLYIVATPIGNLSDITYRAVEILKEVDYILCEDTRQSFKLFQRYSIKTPRLSYHSHSGIYKLNKIKDLFEKNKNIALISDAGTPGISDPGYHVIQLARELEIDIIPIPGPAAFLTGLQASGVPINKFFYNGFLPVKKGRQTAFKELAKRKETIVLYESPHRLVKTLNQINEFFSKDRELVIARELTKKFETFYRFKINQIPEIINEIIIKGEFVIIIA